MVFAGIDFVSITTFASSLTFASIPSK